MKRSFISVALVLGLLMSFAGGALVGKDDNNGQAVGNDPVRLPLTQCSDAGGGNGGEFEVGVFALVDNEIVGFSFYSECLGKSWSELSVDELYAIGAQSPDCAVIPISQDAALFACEIDPGNSGGHNNAQH